MEINSLNNTDECRLHAILFCSLVTLEKAKPSDREAQRLLRMGSTAERLEGTL